MLSTDRGNWPVSPSFGESIYVENIVAIERTTPRATHEIDIVAEGEILKLLQPSEIDIVADKRLSTEKRRH